jgi:hypothetical protein
MKKITLSLILLILFSANWLQAQTGRYKQEVFTDAQIQVATGIPYATNLNWLIINTTDLGTPSNAAQVGAELTYLKTAMATGKKYAIPKRYYFPKGTPGGAGDTTILKVTTLMMNAYMPNPTIDNNTKRPVVIYLHTGNFLPPGTNGSPCGDKSDSVVVDICKGLAKRGFIALAIDYRLGWNPIATTLDGRRGTLLNAVYRSIHDVQECVRTVRGPGMAAYNIDTANIAIMGEGTGGYIALAYNTLDKYPEFLDMAKFKGADFKPYIDTAKVGWLDGSRGLFNLYSKSSINTKVKVIGNIGGALADTSWLTGGEAPIISMQCVRDPFAPFGYGLVTVPPPIGQDVVDVDGANNTIMRAQRIGVNASFSAITSADPYTKKARSLYNRTVDYILAPPDDKITIRSGEGMYPFLLPKAATQFTNQASPWQWWDPNSPEGKKEVSAGVTAHMAASASNTDMSKAKSRLYQDTIFGYMARRMAYSMGLLTANDLGVNTVKVTGVKVYPNPASSSVNISFTDVINSVSISDISGKVVYKAEVNSTFHNIPSLNLNNGLYFVNVITSQGTAVEKLVIK